MASPSIILVADGNDYYILPLPSGAQINGDWTIEFDFYLGSGDVDHQTMIGFGNTDDESWSTLVIQYDSDKKLLVILADNIPNITGFDTGIDSMTANMWHHIKVYKSGNTLHGEVTPEGGSLASGSCAWATVEANITTLGAWINTKWGGNDSPLEYLINGRMIKNLEGSFWEFAYAFTDADKLLFADVSDYVYTIQNVGALTGDIIQATEANRMKLYTGSENTPPAETVDLDSNIDYLIDLDSYIDYTVDLNSYIGD